MALTRLFILLRSDKKPPNFAVITEDLCNLNRSVLWRHFTSADTDTGGACLKISPSLRPLSSVSLSVSISILHWSSIFCRRKFPVDEELQALWEHAPCLWITKKKKDTHRGSLKVSLILIQARCCLYFSSNELKGLSTLIFFFRKCP